MTKQQMIDAVRALGCSVQVLDGEIRVNLRGGSESTAYYTNDRDDAVATAKAMARHALADCRP
jgi:hypothetical protein